VNSKLGDAPIEPALLDLMNEVADGLDTIFNGTACGDARPTGFVLLTFPYGDRRSGRCNFISNGADRKDLIALFKEMIFRFEGGAKTEGTA